VHAEALSDINRFTDIWHAGLILFAVRLLLIELRFRTTTAFIVWYAWNWREPVAEAELRPHESR
jgi:hypothetical protein